MRTEGRRWTLIATGALILWACVTVAMAQGRGGQADNWTDNLPPGDGKTLTAERCSSCHSLERTVQLRKPKNGWEDIVFDMVYNPTETPLLRDARARGLKTVDGLSMLIHQASMAFTYFFGVSPQPADGAELRAVLTS